MLAGFDGPLWGGPLHRPGPIRAVAELSIAGDEAELGISVDAGLRRRGVGTYLVQTAGALLAPRGVRRVRAYTLPGNASFLKLAHAIGGTVEAGPDEVEVLFDVAALRPGYRRRRAAELLRPRCLTCQSRMRSRTPSAPRARRASTSVPGIPAGERREVAVVEDGARGLDRGAVRDAGQAGAEADAAGAGLGEGGAGGAGERAGGQDVDRDRDGGAEAADGGEVGQQRHVDAVGSGLGEGLGPAHASVRS